MLTKTDPKKKQEFKDDTMRPDDLRVSAPIFTLSEAARHLGLSRTTVHRWARPADDNEPLISTLGNGARYATVPFVGFAEAFVLASFRRAGVPLQRIRPAVDALQNEIGVEHALASKRLYTDGAEVLFDYATKHNDRDIEDLVVVRTQQRQFAEVVQNYLKRIEYGGDGWADSLRLPIYAHADVVVDPRVAFGLPLVAGARVEDLVDRFRAGDSVAAIADDFDVPPDQVEDVIRVATMGSN